VAELSIGRPGNNQEGAHDLTQHCYNLINNSVALVREGTIPIERPPLIGEVGQLADRGVLRGQRSVSPRP
jgi:hypothetical protein